jgi:hypothetical protein
MGAAPLRARGQSEQGNDNRDRSQTLHAVILRLILRTHAIDNTDLT